MPIFDYECSDCEHKEERIVKSYDEEQTCPQCDGDMERLCVSRTNFTLKGNWFKTSGEY